MKEAQQSIVERKLRYLPSVMSLSPLGSEANIIV